MTANPPLTEPQIVALGTAVLSNSRELQREAVLLREAGHVPRAYALAHLALEELAKAQLLCSQAISVILGRSIDWKAFWGRWRNHTAKMQTAVVLDLLSSSGWPRKHPDR
jgi:AbiV family abortive infection protein